MSEWIYPAIKPRTKKDGDKTLIFDIIRRKFIVLTPEEWVRQHVVYYLTRYLQYPRSLIRCESGLKYNNMNLRSDIIVYDRNGNIFLAVECKAATVKIEQKTFDQLSVYNQHYHARYLVLTNGLQEYVAEVDYIKKKYSFVKEIPIFPGSDKQSEVIKG